MNIKELNFKERLKRKLVGATLVTSFIGSLLGIGGSDSNNTINIDETDLNTSDTFSNSTIIENDKTDDNLIINNQEFVEDTNEIVEEEIEVVSIEKEEEQLIKHYCNIYSLNYDIVYDIISQWTNNFTDSEYVNNNKIGNSTMKNKYVECNSKDLAILIAVRNIFYLHNDYGYTTDQITSNTNYQSELSYEAQIAKYSDTIGIDKFLTYSVCKNESNFDNSNFKDMNNPANIAFSGNTASFPTTEAGFIEIGLELLKTNMNGNYSIQDISKMYSSNGSINTSWSNKVSNIYTDATNLEETVFNYENSENEFVTNNLEVTDSQELVDIEELTTEVEDTNILTNETTSDVVENNVTSNNDDSNSTLENVEDNQNIVLNVNDDKNYNFYESYLNSLKEEKNILIHQKNSMNYLITNYLNNEVQEEEIVEDVIDISEEEKLIKYYADVYCLDYDIVFKIISELTDNFTAESYLNNNVIGASTMKSKYINCNSKELAVLIAVRSIYYTPINYGYKFSDLSTGVQHTSNLSYEAMISKAADVVNVDKYLAYAICRYESNFNSNLFVNKNNPAGIRFSSEWEYFASKEAGFIELTLELLKYNMNGRTTISSIGQLYTPTSDPSNSSWVNKINYFYSVASSFDHSVFCYDDVCENTDSKEACRVLY